MVQFTTSTPIFTHILSTFQSLGADWVYFYLHKYGVDLRSEDLDGAQAPIILTMLRTHVTGVDTYLIRKHAGKMRIVPLLSAIKAIEGQQGPLVVTFEHQQIHVAKETFDLQKADDPFDGIGPLQDPKYLLPKGTLRGCRIFREQEELYAPRVLVRHKSFDSKGLEFHFREVLE